MTMLEKSAVALMNRQRKSHGLPPIGAEMFDAEEIEYAKDLARAVLIRVREPDDAIESEGNVALSRNGLDSVEGDDSSVCFTAMIDAILNEKPEGLSDV